MNSAIRHYSVRLWGAVLIGIALNLLVLPWWQRAWGGQWLIAPAAGLLIVVFVALGWGMNRFGEMLLKRRFREASVWERAGLVPETRSAFEQAAALFDSFWLSPSRRLAVGRWVSSRVARFHLAAPVPGYPSRSLVAGHLVRFADDETVAESWLDKQLTLEDHLPEEYAAAAAVADALADHDRIQWRLFQFFLKEDRADFSALKTYQRVWEERSSFPETLLADLARLLLARNQLNDWCLQVYLRAYEAGVLVCLEGIGAAVRWLPENIDNAHDLASARLLVEDLSQEQLETLTEKFEAVWQRTALKRHQGPVGLKHAGRRLAGAAATLLRWGERGGQKTGQWLRLATGMFRQPSAAFWKAGLGVIGVALLVLVVWIWRPWPTDIHDARPLQAPPTVEALAPITTDPFTIQVAAYLKPEDAEGYVQTLKSKGLDAFSTRATSAQRVWYQVKVSHFPTKTQAQQYGDQLKSKGLIDDFYVANYKQGE